MRIEFVNTNPDDFGSKIISRVVLLPKCTKSDYDEWSLFAFLHEIGHIKTNTDKMKRCVQEYLATKWAMEEAKRIGFDVPERYISTYQKYIWGWWNRAYKRGCKTLPEKEDLDLRKEFII